MAFLYLWLSDSVSTIEYRRHILGLELLHYFSHLKRAEVSVQCSTSVVHGLYAITVVKSLPLLMRMSASILLLLSFTDWYFY